MRPAPYLFEMGVRLAFLFGGWIGADFSTIAEQQKSGAHFGSPSPVAIVDLLRLQAEDGHKEFALYMQESMAFYGGTGAYLVVSGDRVKVLRGPDVNWDMLVLFLWPSGKDLQRMKHASAYERAHEHWERAVAESESWTFIQQQ